ncbi:unnamed protein product [Didymodactylos carnosus]|uniref:Uncharacterized protein n=1 Tax=Didymodactylos carnosus TaxID=1234261 RepID=A0A813TK73_9BILA|nr:unnamed protein product [Didymodactylos carnosus]CAF0810906.1 unnamed protein product [Didymodactylos carnosus]CAF3572696.1 unnamed protein product [Didymodactylos carnosus]CAF3596536.1 unnamed protein product [Didymodactylos carnosus]
MPTFETGDPGGIISKNDRNDRVECYGCNYKIEERYYLMAIDKIWHLSCLRCFDCNQSLEKEVTCFSRDKQIYCKDDYIKRYCRRICSRCHMLIRPNELIMRAKQYIYHLECFSCISCNHRLHPGDEFGLKDDELFCRVHYYEYELYLPSSSINHLSSLPPSSSSKLSTCLNSTQYSPLPFMSDESDYYSLPLQTTSDGNNSCRTTNSKITLTIANKRARKRKINRQEIPDYITTSSSPSSIDPNADLFSLDGYYLDDVENSLLNDPSSLSQQQHSHHNHSHHQRQKRVRTSFKHHQLRCMRSYFNLNHNPDAKDLKNLAEKTGLQKRVLQVWFQNARAKFRRSSSRTDSKNATTNSNSRNNNTSDIDGNPSSIRNSSSSKISYGEDSSNMSSLAESEKTSSLIMSESETYGST